MPKILIPKTKMIFSWGQKRASKNSAGMATKGNSSDAGFDLDLAIPDHFRCPVSLNMMRDPVTLSTGITYDRDSIERWIGAGNVTCPVTNLVLTAFDPIPNHSIRKMIQDWCEEKKSFGVERIPTPRIPISPSEVSEISKKVQSAGARKDAKKCLELIGQIRILARESERNRRCFVENGIGFALASSFESFAGEDDSLEDKELVLKDLLGALTWTFPNGIEGASKIGSATSLNCLFQFLSGEDLSSRQHAVIVLRELLPYSPDYSTTLIKIDGVSEAVFKVIQVPICPAATKSALMVIHHILKFSENCDVLVSKFIEFGMVDFVLEMLVDADKSTAEKALGVVDRICNWEAPRKAIFANALSLPLLVKKILRVSEMGTEFAVSAIWKLFKEVENESSVIEVLQVGAFQKLLVVLQVGYGDLTKERITELLKLMNMFRNKVDCFDSSSRFQYVQKPY